MNDILSTVKALESCTRDQVLAAFQALPTDTANTGPILGTPALRELFEAVIVSPEVADQVLVAMRVAAARAGQEAIDELARRRDEIAQALINGGLADPPD